MLAGAGDNVVSASSIYGGTHTSLRKMASRRGVEARFVDTLDEDAYAAAVDADTDDTRTEYQGSVNYESGASTEALLNQFKQIKSEH
jgi:O-acetylhomoserine (thiol)-lyase